MEWLLFALAAGGPLYTGYAARGRVRWLVAAVGLVVTAAVGVLVDASAVRVANDALGGALLAALLTGVAGVGWWLVGRSFRASHALGAALTGLALTLTIVGGFYGFLVVGEKTL